MHVLPKTGLCESTWCLVWFGFEKFENWKLEANIHRLVSCNTELMYVVENFKLVTERRGKHSGDSV